MDRLHLLGVEIYKKFLHEEEPERRQQFFEEEKGMGRVTAQYGRYYTVETKKGKVTASPRGKLLYDSDLREIPVVGDWVVTEAPLHSGETLIREVLPRKTVLSRKEAGRKTSEQILAVNMDTVFIVSGLDENFNLKRIERLLVLAYESGAQPVVLLNKADICVPEEKAAKFTAAQESAIGVPIHITSAATGFGLTDLRSYFQHGGTAVFIGSSGVGKSSLVNKLIGRDIQKIRETRRGDGKGKHTTSRGELFILPRGGSIIDTPGLKEIQLWAEEDSLSRVFPDIEELAEACRFRDCRHESEPGCAVKAALSEGRISREHFTNYQKMHREISYLDRKKDARAAQEEKLKWKNISRAAKEYKKLKRG